MIMKKIFLTVVIAFAAMLTASCQTSKNTKAMTYTKVDVMPEYPGGTPAMMKFISENLKYPAEAQKLKEQGTVVVKFFVEKDGSLNGFSILHHATPALDDAAIELVKKMPKWKPGTMKGKAVRVQLALPVGFRLN